MSRFEILKQRWFLNSDRVEDILSIHEIDVQLQPDMQPVHVISAAERYLERAIGEDEETVTLPCSILLFVLQELRRVKNS